MQPCIQSIQLLSPSIDSQVVAIAKRCSISNADKHRIVLAVAACKKPGGIGALIRREGVYSSALAASRRKCATGGLNGTDFKKRGPKPAPARDELKQFTLMTHERDKLRVQLCSPHLTIEVQKKVATSLDQLEPSRKFKWRSKYGGMDATEAKLLRELELENGKLKRLLAEAHLDIHALKSVFGTKR